MQLTCQTQFSAALLELLAFSIFHFFWGDVFCPTRPKAFTDHAHPPQYCYGGRAALSGRRSAASQQLKLRHNLARQPLDETRRVRATVPSWCVMPKTNSRSSVQRQAVPSGRFFVSCWRRLACLLHSSFGPIRAVAWPGVDHGANSRFGAGVADQRQRLILFSILLHPSSAYTFVGCAALAFSAARFLQSRSTTARQLLKGCRMVELKSNSRKTGRFRGAEETFINRH